MVSFFKHDIAHWMDGTEKLSDGAYRAYHVILQLIYLNDGPITLNLHGIAGRCRQRADRFQRHLKELVDAKKITIHSGKIHNVRASEELGKITSRRSLAARLRPSKPELLATNAEVVGDNHKLIPNSPELSPDNPLKSLNGTDPPTPIDKRRVDKPPNPPGGWWDQFLENWPVKSDATANAREAFDALTVADRIAAVAGIPAFIAEAGKHDRRLCSPRRYLAERRWENLQPRPVEAAPPVRNGAEIQPDTPQWKAWKAYFKSRGREPDALLSLNRMMTCIDYQKPYRAPSEWPPSEEKTP